MIDRFFRDPPLVLGHRGASAGAPENTLEAFRLARREGADGVELDVRRTAEGALAVIHDALVPGLGAVVDTTLDALRDARADLPTLEQALEACAGMLVNIEIKNWDAEPDWDPHDRVAEEVVALVGRLGLHDEVLISSFNPATVRKVRGLDPRIATGLLIGPPADLFDAIEQASHDGHVAIHPWMWGMEGEAAGPTIGAARARGLRVVVWTVDEPAELRRLARLGVDAIISNDPGAARRALQG